MLKPLVLYGLSTGINRGAGLLFLPLLTATYSIEEYGLYMLSLATAQVLVPILTLNGGGAIVREGLERPEDGRKLLWMFLGIALAAGGLAAGPVAMLDRTAHRWLTYAVVLGAIESAHELLLQFVRSRERPWAYLGFVTAKTAGLLGAALMARTQAWPLERLLAAQSAWYGGLTLFPLFLAARRRPGGGGIRFLDVFGYSVAAVPHTLAHGVMSNGSRWIIKALAGDAALGLYSVGYTLAQFLMLLNSGLSLALTPEVFKNYERWTAGTLRGRAIRRYTATAVLVVVAVLAGIEIDRRAFGLIGHYDPRLFVVTALVGMGFYFIGIYQFFTHYLFYLKRTGVLSV
ncbi:MAG TPA: hypothetical protein VEJ18_03060, partial [Planctomycetota bacterium]|nr:hypothetical protein [Planctomycetota bacterium]